MEFVKINLVSFSGLDNQLRLDLTMEDILREAVSMGQTSEVDSLLKKGVNAEIMDENGQSLLHIACTVNETKILRLLLNHGLDIEAEDHHYNTALHVAYVTLELWATRFENLAGYGRLWLASLL